MDIILMGKNRLELLRQWRNSPEYREICVKQKQECDRLVRIAQQIYAYIEDIRVRAENATVRTEMAVGSNIHRGVYCPSPILDIVVGNVSRGRILKRATSLSKVSHQFEFDNKGSLLSSKSIGNDMLDVVEYIVHQGVNIYGLAIDPSYGPTFISEESFVDQKLVAYRYANLICEDNGLGCLTLHSESYHYDNLGLKSSDWVDYRAVINSFDCRHYEFERENGSLSTYKAIEKPFDQNQKLLSFLPTYTIQHKRKS